MVRRFLVSIAFLVAGMSFQVIGATAGTHTASSLDYGDRISITIVYPTPYDFADALIVEPKPPISEPPIDWASQAFHVANQVGQRWRTNADAYRHIDPGRT